jgi:hypothetical protein
MIAFRSKPGDLVSQGNIGRKSGDFTYNLRKFENEASYSSLTFEIRLKSVKFDDWIPWLPSSIVLVCGNFETETDWEARISLRTSFLGSDVGELNE